jgi:hypothetical protein
MKLSYSPNVRNGWKTDIGDLYCRRGKQCQLGEAVLAVVYDAAVISYFWRRAAWSLWITPPIMLFPLFLPVLEPSSIAGVLREYWELYLLFVGLPWALGVYCWRRANRALEAA